MMSAPPKTPATKGLDLGMLIDEGLNLRDENERLESVTAEERVAWALRYFKPNIILSSSFGAQAAVSLHMVIQQWADIPVVLVDTGYLFPQTYQFIDELVDRLKLNLVVAKPDMSPAWQEARFGRLWEQGTEGIEKYNLINKVQPMNRILEELGAQAWITGLRRTQSLSRKDLTVLALAGHRVKIHPIIDWTDKDIYLYLKKYDLPYHPLWHEGYISVGDWHTSHKVSAEMDPEQARFFGLKRECGLHENVTTDFSI